MTTIEELSGPAEYREASFRFRMIWDEYLDIEKEAKDEIASMVRILEDEGYSRTKAIQKIIEDHKDLKGFSRATIYRELPNEMKNNYISSAKQLSITGNVSNETFEKSQEQDANVVNNTTSQHDTQDVEETKELSSFEVNLPPPEPELQDPKVTAFVGKLPKSVLRHAEKIALPQSKLELLANYSNKSILKDHRQIQEKLVKSIAPLTMDQAKIEISQAIRDLETGALQKVEGQNYYITDRDRREKIPKKPDRIKHPLNDFLQFQTKTFPEMMYLLTGHKLDEDETSYEPNHIDNTEKHRQEIVNHLDGRQKQLLLDHAELLSDALSSLMDIIIGGSTTKL
jgi:hypothetical protein